MPNSRPTSEVAILAVMGLVGLLLMLVATNVIPTADEKFHVPRWVLFVCGLIFALPGVASLFPRHSEAPRYLIAAMIFCFGVVGIACGLLGESEHFSGGLPFVSHETNTRLARGVFVFFGMICFLLSVLCVSGYGTVMGESHKREDEDETA